MTMVPTRMFTGTAMPTFSITPTPSSPATCGSVAFTP
jgi:hypothetical protein